MPVEDIAARFGLSTNVVNQRLKLASVSSRLIAEYRSGAMTLEQLMAFTISDDPAVQERVWFENPYAEIPAQAIRRMLTKSLVPATDRRARFIGHEAYEQASGTLVRDLFEPDDAGYFADSQLLDGLVAEKLQQESETVRGEGWGWVEILPEIDYVHIGRFARINPGEVALSEEEEAQLSALSIRYDELVSIMEETGGEATAAGLDRVTAELDVLQAKKETWPEEEKQRAGVMISLDHDGSLHIIKGLIKPEDRKREVRAEQGPSEPAPRKSKAEGYPDTVLVELSVHRTAALRELLARQPNVAIAANLYALASRIFYGEAGNLPIQITPVVTDIGRLSQTIGESKAAAALLCRHETWCRRVPEEYSALWAWLLGLGETDRCELLAYCTAVTVDVIHRPGFPERSGIADQLARATALDMLDWWKPTQSGFFDHLTKEQITKAVSEGVSVEAAHGLAGRKKSQMAADAELLVGKTGWLPETLRASQHPERQTAPDTEELAVAE
jgi:ParB family chromosome partitioning protein